MEIITKTAAETQKLGETIAANIVGDGLKDRAIVLLLSGELGSGKTTFIQGFSKGLGISDRTISPTYILSKQYRLSGIFQFFYHIDLYRLENGADGESLGLSEILNDPKNIVAIEWPERLGSKVPKNAISVTFTGEEKRLISINGLLNLQLHLTSS